MSRHDAGIGDRRPTTDDRRPDRRLLTRPATVDRTDDWRPTNDWD